MNESTNTTTENTTSTTVYRMHYVPVGGVNYSSIDDTVATDDIFDTVEGAAQEWARRRNDWTGRFPCWGDGGDGAETTAVLGMLFLQDDDDNWTVACDVVEGYSVRELEEHIGESVHYYDEQDDDEQDDDQDDEPVRVKPIAVHRRFDPPHIPVAGRSDAVPVERRDYADGLVMQLDRFPSGRVVGTVWIWADGLQGGCHRRAIDGPSDVGALVAGFRRGLSKLGLYDRGNGGLYSADGRSRRSISATVVRTDLQGNLAG